MALINLNDLIDNQPDKKQSEKFEALVGSFFSPICPIEITKKFKLEQITKGTIIPFWTNGAFAIHQLLAEILQVTGPSEVYLTTWTITQAPLESLYDLKDKKLISKLTGVVDYRIKAQSSKRW